jgi:hypothetical protein
MKPLSVLGTILVGTVCAVSNGELASGSSNPPATTIASQPTGQHADYVSAPGHNRIHKSCVHDVPSHARIDENRDVWVGGKKIDHIAPCEYAAEVPGTQGWVVGETQVASNVFTALTATFSVPPPPSAGDGQAVTFIWPGMETQSVYLIQPVLQFNQADRSEWEMENYFVMGATTIAHDNAIAVNQGDWINTVMEIDYTDPGANCQVSGADCNYVVGWQDSTQNGPWHSLTTVAPEPYTFGQAAIFEAAGEFSGCNDFPAGSPAGSVFAGINFYEPNPSQSGSSGLFWPDAYAPSMGEAAFSLPSLRTGAAFNCSFQAAVIHSLFGTATNGVTLEWNSTQAPQDPL